MATINEQVRLRRSIYGEIKRALKAVDTGVEETQRQVERVRTRKNKYPEEKDLLRTIELIVFLNNLLRDLVVIVNNAETSF